MDSDYGFVHTARKALTEEKWPCGQDIEFWFRITHPILFHKFKFSRGPSRAHGRGGMAPRLFRAGPFSDLGIATPGGF